MPSPIDLSAPLLHGLHSLDLTTVLSSAHAHSTQLDACFDALAAGLASSGDAVAQPIEQFLDAIQVLDDPEDRLGHRVLFVDADNDLDFRRTLARCHVASYAEGRQYFARDNDGFPVEIGERCLQVLQRLTPEARVAILSPSADAQNRGVVALNYDGTVILQLPSSRWRLPVMPDCCGDAVGAFTEHEMQGLRDRRLQDGRTVGEMLDAMQAEMTMQQHRKLARWQAFNGRAYAQAGRFDLSAQAFVSACAAALRGDDWSDALVYCRDAFHGLVERRDASLSTRLGAQLVESYLAHGFVLVAADVRLALAAVILDQAGSAEVAARHCKLAGECFTAVGLEDISGRGEFEIARQIQKTIEAHREAWLSSGLVLKSYAIRFDAMRDYWTGRCLLPGTVGPWCLMRRVLSDEGQQGVLEIVAIRTAERFVSSAGAVSTGVQARTRAKWSMRDFYSGLLMLDILRAAKANPARAPSLATLESAALQRFLSDHLPDLHFCIELLEFRLENGVDPDRACEEFVSEVTAVGGWYGWKPLLKGNAQVADFRVALAECHLASIPQGRSYLATGGRDFPQPRAPRNRWSFERLERRVIGEPNYPFITAQRSLQLLRMLTPEARAKMLLQTPEAARSAPEAVAVSFDGLISLVIPGTRFEFPLMPADQSDAVGGVTRDEISRLMSTYVRPGKTIREHIEMAHANAPLDALRALAQGKRVYGERYAEAGRDDLAAIEFAQGCEAAMRTDDWGAAAHNARATLDCLGKWPDAGQARTLGMRLIEMFEAKGFRLLAAMVRWRLADEVFEPLHHTDVAAVMRRKAMAVYRARGVPLDAGTGGAVLDRLIRREIAVHREALQSEGLPLHRYSIRFDNLQDVYARIDFDVSEARGWGMIVRGECQSGRSGILDIVSDEALALLEKSDRHPTAYRDLRPGDLLQGVVVLDILQTAATMRSPESIDQNKTPASTKAVDAGVVVDSRKTGD
ncbi:hypothetical protein PAQ31011_04484 [Pandoraea aquatica]|uniref:Uncharacterized protein n=1 Tax=Pandoraea aquatica TaxID=2508290 RepID=A0A5E4YE70_9BURK|nr:hypothetical protein [Pandoraea aquatica]VVE47039.1 hypothetical protein PAQ31011_04484 [Pandoraea aquatica]